MFALVYGGIIPGKHEALAQCWADVGPASYIICILVLYFTKIYIIRGLSLLASEQETLTRCWFDAGPASQKVAQH